MPNIKSAKKRVRITAVENLRNKAVRSNLKTVLKKAEAAVSENSADKEAIVRQAVKTIDQASAKGILHKNTAARKKSQIMSKLNHAV